MPHRTPVLAGALGILIASALAANAQQSTVSALAAEGYEVRSMTTFDVNPGDDRDDQSVFLIMQNETDVYGCVLESITSSFCQRIE